jgi:hypothetical protein
MSLQELQILTDTLKNFKNLKINKDINKNYILEVFLTSYDFITYNKNNLDIIHLYNYIIEKRKEGFHRPYGIYNKNHNFINYLLMVIKPLIPNITILDAIKEDNFLTVYSDNSSYNYKYSDILIIKYKSNENKYFYNNSQEQLKINTNSIDKINYNLKNYLLKTVIFENINNKHFKYNIIGFTYNNIKYIYIINLKTENQISPYIIKYNWLELINKTFIISNNEIINSVENKENKQYPIFSSNSNLILIYNLIDKNISNKKELLSNSSKDDYKKFLFIDYEGLSCWFSSIISTIFYSDNMNKLIKMKSTVNWEHTNDINIENINTKNKWKYSKLNPQEIFKTILYYNKDINYKEFFNKIKQEDILDSLNNYNKLMFPVNRSNILAVSKSDFYITKILNYIGLDNFLILYKKENNPIYYNSLLLNQTMNPTRNSLSNEYDFIIVIYDTITIKNYIFRYLVNNNISLKDKFEILFKKDEIIEYTEKYILNNSKNNLNVKDNTLKLKLKINENNYLIDNGVFNNINEFILFHSIGAVTIDNKRFIYNRQRVNYNRQGINLSNKNTYFQDCYLFKYDWTNKNKPNFRIDYTKCGLKLTKLNSSNSLSFLNPFDQVYSLTKGQRIFIFINEKIIKETTNSLNTNSLNTNSLNINSLNINSLNINLLNSKNH